MKPILAQSGLVAALTVFASLPAFAADETNRVDLKDFSAFRLITDRNIFDPNRRGPVVYTPRPERTVVDSFALAGTLSYSNVLVAFFDGSKSDYRKALKVSDQIAGHELTEIGYDQVKLSSGTNEVDVKVGMEMRRSPDGRWTVGEASRTSSYASNSRRRDRDRRDSSRQSYSRNGSRRNASASDSSRSETNAETPPEMAGGPPPDQPPGEEMQYAPDNGAPPDNAASADEDPVARMMRRRQQETGNENP